MYNIFWIAFSSGTHQGCSNFMTIPNINFSQTPFTQRLNTESRGNKVIRKTSYSESGEVGISELQDSSFELKVMSQFIIPLEDALGY